MAKSFLHPSQRPLKTEQIGPSSHKNEYHVGVLEGNWQEERHAFGRHAQGPQKFDGRTVMRDSFPRRSEANYKAAVPPTAPGAAEAPRELLFGHGKGPVKSMLTVAELSYKRPEDSMKTTKLAAIEGVSERRTLLEKKRAEWDEGSEKKRYVTTKNASLDATADYVKEHPDYTPGPSKSHGIFMRSLGAAMNKTGLRSDY